MANYDLGKTGVSIKSAINSAILKLDEIAFNEDRVLISSVGKVKDSAITVSELNALSGIDSNIQTQLNTKYGDGDSVSGSTFISSNQTQTLTAVGIYYTLTYVNNIIPVGISMFGQSTFKTAKSGRYAISFSGLYSTNKTNPIIEATAFTGTTSDPSTESNIGSGGKLGASGDLRTGGTNGFLDLDADVYVCVKLKSDTASTIIEHRKASFSMVRIGPKGA